MESEQRAGVDTPAEESKRATADEYVPVAVSVLPESVTLATMNEQNRQYWKNAGGEQS